MVGSPQDGCPVKVYRDLSHYTIVYHPGYAARTAQTRLNEKAPNKSITAVFKFYGNKEFLCPRKIDPSYWEIKARKGPSLDLDLDIFLVTMPYFPLQPLILTSVPISKIAAPISPSPFLVSSISPEPLSPGSVLQASPDPLLGWQLLRVSW